MLPDLHAVEDVGVSLVIVLPPQIAALWACGQSEYDNRSFAREAGRRAAAPCGGPLP